MNRQFRKISAFRRGVWLIEPTFAEAHLPLIQSFLAGEFNPKLLQDDEDDQEEDGPDRLSRISYAVTAATSDNGSANQTATADRRYALDDPELPDDSIFVLDIRGAIFKESDCCSIGTEDYCKLLDQAYAHEKIIGIVCLVDSPGGQLSGTPSLYDALRNPAKPTVSVINEGMMASAAYWLACGSDDIYATQKSDQVGSIGVYVQFDDYTERKKQMGITTHSIYSDRSSEKNLPFREALAGNPALLREDLNKAADLFREAVEQGRGDRLKPVKKGGADVFKGGLFYASQAIDLGLIDGFGNLNTAVARVVELHNARKSSKQSAAPRSSGGSYAVEQVTTVETVNFPSTSGKSENLIASIKSTGEQAAPLTSEEPSTITDAPEASTAAPELSDSEPTETPVVVEGDSNSNSSTPNPIVPMNIFGYTHLPALAAIAGVAAADVTEEQIDAINAAFQAGNFNVHAISAAQFVQIQTLQGQLTTAQNDIAAKDKEIARLGKQPGAMGTKVPKEEEAVAPETGAGAETLSETDQILAETKAKMKRG
ncbi:hypothetical protein GCM10028805_47380 [Spirosoma harenae]